MTRYMVLTSQLFFICFSTSSLKLSFSVRCLSTIYILRFVVIYDTSFYFVPFFYPLSSYDKIYPISLFQRGSSILNSCLDLLNSLLRCPVVTRTTSFVVHVSGIPFLYEQHNPSCGFSQSLPHDSRLPFKYLLSQSFHRSLG